MKQPDVKELAIVVRARVTWHIPERDLLCILLLCALLLALLLGDDLGATMVAALPVVPDAFADIGALLARKSLMATASKVEMDMDTVG